jgi:NADH-quinone oxidoreductase subunit L
VTGEGEHGEPVIAPGLIMAVTIVLVVAGAVLAWRQYAISTVPVIPPVGAPLTRAARVDLYQDSVNDALLVEPGQHLTRSLVYVDRTLVDGAAVGVGESTAGLGSILRKTQTGFVRSYAATMLIGLVVLVATVLVIQS